nr:uncharacterized protein LOC115255489 [Aedes albopictus]
MAEKKIKSKELKRKNIMDSIQRIDDFLGNFDAERDQNEIAIRLSRLDKLMEAFESIQGEYEAFDDSPEFEAANTKPLMWGEVQLHCFTDASESAYGTCVYARTVKPNGEVMVMLLASKSRVAPLKKRSIPRLELCAAQLGAQLSSRVVAALKMETTWKTFVSNRVADIHTITNSSMWHHVPGVDNPADLVSRGMAVPQFLSSSKWIHGPDWLGEGEETWPKLAIPQTTLADVEDERKTTTLLTQNLPPLNPLFARSSSFDRLLRTTAYCLRFAHHTRKEAKQTTITLNPNELDSARDRLVMVVQAECFKAKILLLKRGKPVANNSSLKLLNPFLDSSGIIRVGGRLKLSTESYTTKHQILLPGFHKFTRLLLMSYHRKLIHGGVSLTLGTVRNEYWPTNGRRAVRSVIRTCYRCTRANPRPLQQPVGQLPLTRVTPSRPFASTGIDYCGPVFVKTAYRNNPKRSNLKVGQVMILQDSCLPPVRWPLVRIVELHPGQDGVTRVVTVRTPTGAIMKRAVTKLCPLPTTDEEETTCADESPTASGSGDIIDYEISVAGLCNSSV